ncbi:putative rhamnosyl transferase [Cognatishimia sp. SS12]|uniref:putative rhamnosyl transferase n=1 Tax=Cognatishimia sp. SS12 TaxID=2979465 RepID=UPI00232F1741|nr:putative rhamnosyl transferase [Cognatishimia sp. SS12]MDC0738393.1 putative rhamnosyl transferase [Cognatishimia sp. SS12]
MQASDMQVIGLCRFSYPALGGFQVEHDSIEDRRAFLYAPERMEERLRMFETIALPGLKAQTDQNFDFLIVVGSCLPKPYLERLHAMTADMPQARIIAEDPAPHRQIMKKIINRSLNRNTALPSLQFRHDDDDAVSVNFVARLRAAVDDTASLVAKNPLVGFDFNRGYSARPSAEGMLATPTVLPSYGVALAMAVAQFKATTIMNFAHSKLHQFMPTVTYTDEDMFVRGHNGFNDSRQGKRVKPLEMTLLDAAGEAHFEKTFAINCDQVRRAFA